MPNGRTRSARTRSQTPAVLKGLIFRPTGAAMSPTHTRKGQKLYRYYLSQAVIKGEASGSVGRVPAAEVEHANPPTIVYFPNLLFFTSGTDQYFTNWSRSYAEQNFYIDTLLISGEFGAAQMVNVASDVQTDVSRAGEAVVGAILVRQSGEAP